MLIKIKLAKEKVLNGQHYAVHVKENEEGIIIDVWHRNGELINTYQYWNDDVVEAKQCQCGSCEKEFLLNSLMPQECPHCHSGNYVEGCIDDPTKQCAVCNATFTQYRDAKTADERTLCEECRIATNKLK